MSKKHADNKPIDGRRQENALARADFAPELRAGCEKLGFCEGRRLGALPLRAAAVPPAASSPARRPHEIDNFADNS